MKLHLPKMLTAALLAAITAVGSSAFADDVTTFTTTNLSAAGTTKNYNAKGFAIVLNGPRLETTPTSTCDLVYLDTLTLGSLRGVPAGGVTLALADANGKVLSLSENIVSSANQQVTWTFSNTIVATDSTLYFYWLDASKGIAVGNTLSGSDLSSWANAGCGDNGVSDYNSISAVASDNTSCGFLDSLSHIQTTNVRFAPKLSIVTSGPVPQDEYTWKAAGTTALWDEVATNWTVQGADSSYTSGTTNIVNFNDGEFAKNVTVSGDIVAATVNVNDNYAFTVESGNSLSIKTLSVAAGKEATVTGEGSVTLTKVALANGATINVGAATSMAVTVADDANYTAINATRDITLTSLAGPAEGKELTISAEGHTVAVQGNNTFAGDLVVAKGTVKLDSSAHSLGAYNGKNNKEKPAEAPDKTITVNEGGTIDLNGKADQTYIYTLAGGSLVNHGTGISGGSMQTVGIKLTKDSTIGGTGNFYLLGPGYDSTFVTLNEHKLTKTGANSVGFNNTAVSSGTIEVQQGNIEFINGSNSSVAADIILNGGTISGTVNVADDIEITAQKTASINPTLNNANNKTVTLKTAEGQTLTFSSGITLATGKLNVAGTVNVSGSSLDASVGNKSTGTVHVTGEGVLNVNSSLWLCPSSVIEVEEGGTLNIAGLSITAPGEIATLTCNGNLPYGTNNTNFTIANADVTATANVTLGNTLANVDVYTGAHAVTLNATADSVTVAEGGTINFGEAGVAGTITVEDGGIIGSLAKTDAGDTTITSAGTAVLSSVIALNAGSLTMSGAFNVDALEYQGESTIEGGQNVGNGFATEKGTLTVVTVAAETTLTAEAATVVRGGNTFSLANDGTATLNSTNYSAFYITNLSETVTQAKSKEVESGVALASIHVANGAALDVDQNIDLSLVSAETGAKLNILSGHTVSVGDATTTATIAGEGTYALKSGSKNMTGTLAEGADWTGTVAVSNVSISDINLNSYGHEGSKVLFDGVSGYFLQAQAVFAPELVLEGAGLTLNNGFSTMPSDNPKPPTKYTFDGGVSGEGNMNFNRPAAPGATTVTQHLYFTGDVSRWTGSLNVVSLFNVYAQYSGADQKVNSTISRTGGELHVEVGTGSDASVVTFNQAITANDLAVLAGATANINGGLTTSTITVGEGATLAINGNTTLTSAITSAGTVTLTNVALSDAFTETPGGEAKYYIEETQNYYKGSGNKYLTVVTGDGAANATGTGLTWTTLTGLEMANGQVITGAGEANYSTLFVGGDTTSADIVGYGHKDALTNIVVESGTLTLTEGELPQTVAITVSEHGTIAGDVTPTLVEIAKDATAEFTKPVTGTSYKFSAAEDGTVAVTNSGEAAAYTGGNRDMLVEADTLEAPDAWEDVTISNIVKVKNVVAGDAAILTLDNVDGTLDLQNLEIGSMAFVQVYASEEHLSDNEATVVISETLTAGLGSTLNADLTMKGGSTLDLDGSNGIAALTLGSTLTLDTADGLVNLGEDIISYLSNMQVGESVDLFTHGYGTSLDYGDEYEGAYYDALFVRTDALVGDFTVYADGDHFGLTKYNNVPEPTTGTLSLLALAALAARRRKHN